MSTINQSWYSSDGTISRRATLRDVHVREGAVERIAYRIAVGPFTRDCGSMREATGWLKSNGFEKGKA